MKYFKLIFISFVVFFGIATIIAFFIPSNITIFRMVNVAPGQDSILNKVSDISEWKNWYPGFDHIKLKDSVTRNGYTIKASAKNVLLNIKSVTDTSVIVDMQKSGRIVVATWQISKNIHNDSLALQSYMDFKLKWYPWEKFSSLLLDKRYGDVMMRSLLNLKHTDDNREKLSF